MNEKARIGVSLLTGSIAALALLGLSCGREPASTAKRPDPEVRQEGHKTIITVPETGDQLVFGATEEIPAEFPQDLPIAPDCQINNHFKSSNTLFTTFFTSKKIEDVKEFYLVAAPFQEEGWTMEGAKQVARGYNVEFRKEGRRTIISLTISKDPEGTNIAYVTNIP